MLSKGLGVFAKGAGLLIILIFLFAVWRYYTTSGFGKDYPSGGRLTPAQKAMDITAYDFDIYPHPENQSLRITLRVDFRFPQNIPDTLLFDFIDGYDIVSLRFDQKPVTDYSYHNNRLSWRMPASAKSKRNHYIVIRYGGVPPRAKQAPWRGGFVWKTDRADSTWLTLACQGEGGKIWFPTKDTQTDKPDSLTLRITVPKPYMAPATGRLLAVDTLRDSLRYQWKSRYPVSTYGINFGVGRYTALRDTLHSKRPQTVPVIFYSLIGDTAKNRFLLKHLKQLTHVFEPLFGPYPWPDDKLAAMQTPYLGMEHQTLNAYGNRHHYRRIGGHTIDFLMLHELAHEWWGNFISTADWADFWLHEGFATYSEALYVEQVAGKEAYLDYMREKMHSIRNHAPIIAGKNLSTTEAYNGDVYNKGAAFLHSLRFVLGDSLFKNMLYHWATDSTTRGGKTVVTADFLKHVNRYTPAPQDSLFHFFLNTTRRLEFQVDSVTTNRYRVLVPGIRFPLPLQVGTSAGIQKLTIPPGGLIIASNGYPVIDPEDWYYKKETLYTWQK
ncbi:MAG TPA: hypothetical protein ENJ10_07555 [Caldithrix abyssi]|uniref:Aminopeptidase N n=1 Tax=Caldithrix abyssi TaxID=187145 RepID=A0A7V1LZL4_CALAY|nr:hypothetical protein [Caldithrix abyssi]